MEKDDNGGTWGHYSATDETHLDSLMRGGNCCMTLWVLPAYLIASEQLTKRALPGGIESIIRRQILKPFQLPRNMATFESATVLSRLKSGYSEFALHTYMNLSSRTSYTFPPKSCLLMGNRPTSTPGIGVLRSKKSTTQVSCPPEIL